MLPKHEINVLFETAIAQLPFKTSEASALAARGDRSLAAAERSLSSDLKVSRLDNSAV